MINDQLKLDKYVCMRPFTMLEIFPEKVYCCCSNWCDTSIGNTDDLKNILNSDILKKIRHSVLDGTYSYCNRNKCSYLLNLLNDRKVGAPFRLKETLDTDKIFNVTETLELKINIDNSCTLSCPSCRNMIIMANGEMIEKINIKLNEISDVFGKYTSIIHISGTADPFGSKSLQNFLVNFDESKFPVLKKILIYTNANLLNERMWNKIHKVHKYITQIEISIDAATEETYKLVRRNGDWVKLMKNIKFLSTIPSIKNFSYLFVIQDTNYTEMEDFTKLISNIGHTSTFNILFNRIYNFTYTEEEYLKKQIWSESHPEFKLFLIELNKIINVHNVFTDVPDVIDKFGLRGNTKLI